MPKRKREAKASNAKASMPDPPPALIKLLQKDKKVLNYFTSLQSNLNLDVKRWKDKALDYKEKYEELMQQTDNGRDGSRNDEQKKHGASARGQDGERKGKSNARSASQKKSKKVDMPVASIEVPAKSKIDKDDVSMGSEESKGGSDDDSDHSSLSDHDFRDTDIGRSKPQRGLKELQSPNKSKAAKSPKPQPEKDIVDEFDQFSFGDIQSDDSSSSGSFGDIEKDLVKAAKEQSPIGANDNDNYAMNVNSDLDGSENDTSVETNSTVPDQDRNAIRKTILEKLVLAYDDLKLLGVHVVDVKHPVVKKGDKQDQQRHDGSTAVGDDLNGISNQTNEIEDKKDGKKDIMDWDIDFGEFDSSDSDDDKDGEDGGFVGVFQKSKPGRDKGLASEFVKAAIPKLVITRRSDYDVSRDIVSALRSMIRRPTLEVATHHYRDVEVKACLQPFLMKGLIPACYPVENAGIVKVPSGNDSGDESDVNLPVHPLADGLERLIRALAVMDTYCTSQSLLFEQDEWNEVVNAREESLDSSHDLDWEKYESIRVGLKSRDVSNILLSSFEGEILRQWGVIDSGARQDMKLPADPNELEYDDSNEQEKEIRKTDFAHTFNAKDRLKMFNLLERVCTARIVSGLHQFRGDLQSASQVFIDYILTTLPSPTVEDHPRYPPIMSFCVLEALSSPFVSMIASKSEQGYWLSRIMKALDGDSSFLRNTLSGLFHSVATLWQQRSRCLDPKVKGISEVEVAAYNRLCSSECGWLVEDRTDLLPDVEALYVRPVCDSLGQITLENIGKCISVQFMLHWNGDIDQCFESIQNFVRILDALKIEVAPKNQLEHVCAVIVSVVASYLRLQQVQWDASCLSGLSTVLVGSQIDSDRRLGIYIDKMIIKYNSETTSTSPFTVECLKAIMRCCALSSDGNRVYKLAQLLSEQHSSSLSAKRIFALAGFPTVRVINLQCREDRWKQFMTQAQRSQLLVVPAVTSLGNDTETNKFWGLKAHSGKEIGHLLFEQQIAPFLENGKSLNDYVSTHWRPSDLKTFDTNARSDERLVRLSVSERACALSHISSWNGVKNSILEDASVTDDKRLLQSLRISGFASGPPFHCENEGMPPSPVCVILEDDAMLVDQFSDKLAAILAELPRDFHFCSLGYRYVLVFYDLNSKL